MKEVKLTKTQKKLVRSWEKELSVSFNSIASRLQALLEDFKNMNNQVFSFKLDGLALDIGLDPENEDWDWDGKNYAFKERKEDVKETTVKDAGRKKAKKDKKTSAPPVQK